MFPFYCNQCFRRRKFDPTLELNVSRCGHILCKECVKENCCVCSRPFNGKPINKDMPQSMAEYFSNPINQYQQYRKVMKFHYDQEQRLVQHLWKFNEEEQKKARQERQGYIKLQQTLKKEAENERQKINKLREYIAYHERRLEQARYMTPPLRPQPRPRYPSQRNSVENVAPSSCDNNIMQQLTQQLRPNVFYPRSPTLSANNSSITTGGTEFPKPITKKQRAPPPLLPFSQHKLLHQKFTFSSID